ncbi:MAG: hypothetical protein AB7J40_03925 [Candidatus Altimarinota bacterium]
MTLDAFLHQEIEHLQRHLWRREFLPFGGYVLSLLVGPVLLSLVFVKPSLFSPGLLQLTAFALVFFFFALFFSPSKKLRRIRIVANALRKSPGGTLSFSALEFQEAARALETWQPATYEEAVQRYGKTSVEILFLIRAVDQVTDHHFVRVFSLRSIREDREAGYGEE